MIKIYKNTGKGCDICTGSAYSDRKKLRLISVLNYGQFILYRCPSCKSYWEFNLSYCQLIEKSIVKVKYKIKPYKDNVFYKIISIIGYFLLLILIKLIFKYLEHGYIIGT
ncbi:hypothetical protein JYG23_07985 [Sedimentibacter sp. zth1]|uniref:hypothetical protein n=1 Tax=Sedimentibacter sp. zth1 TaxID=2816908 RepID=UPI001A90FBD4|nr:hypothetical protein [Sedimentibacter sp. zth1]QSX04647.1 hypothetical protein JYG23_07985 [Sedimentibacter sp. zth1]